MCSYCDHDDGHDIEHCAERLEDKFGTGTAELREGETRDDDNTHAGDIVERQLAEADDETLAELEDEREVRTDGGTLRAERPQWTPTATTDSSAPRCQNCDRQVTRRFARVFGDNTDTAHACTECTDNRYLARAASNAGGGLR